jgi:hypothetical protein
MKIIRSDALDDLAINISDTFLTYILESNSLQYTWRYMSGGITEDLNSIKIFITDRFGELNENICVIIKVVKKKFIMEYCYFFVVCDIDKLFNIIDKSIKLKSFI